MFDPRLAAPIHLPRHPLGVWPDPNRLPGEGLGAFGGEIEPNRLLSAYEHGFFPCYDESTVPLWWSPDPRAVFVPGSFHASRSLRREAARQPFRVTWNTAFRRVMQECDGNRDGGRWILPEILEGYTALHHLERAFSLEVWLRDELVGGVYGVQIGALFAAESMFHRVTGASKVALAWLLENLFEHGIELVDAQYPTTHLRSLGVVTLPRSEYLGRLSALSPKTVDLVQMQLKTPPCLTR